MRIGPIGLKGCKAQSYGYKFELSETRERGGGGREKTDLDDLTRQRLNFRGREHSLRCRGLGTHIAFFEPVC